MIEISYQKFCTLYTCRIPSRILSIENDFSKVLDFIKISFSFKGNGNKVVICRSSQSLFKNQEHVLFFGTTEMESILFQSFEGRFYVKF